MDPAVAQMVNTYKEAQARYLSTGDPKQKPAADAARGALDEYIRMLEDRIKDTQASLKIYLDGRSESDKDFDSIRKRIEDIKTKTRTVATDYLTAQEYNQPTPIDWTKYYVRLSVLAGLAGGIAIVVLTR